MSITTTYPGVYIVEKPSGNRTIVGVATSVTAFLGRANEGPADDPTPIGNFADYERQFGTLTRDSGLGYAVQDFFLNGGSQALIVRVVHQKAANAPATDTSLSATSRTWEVAVGAGTLRIEANGPGAWADEFTLVVHRRDEEAAADPTDEDAAAAAADADDVANSQDLLKTDLFDLAVVTAPAGEELELHRNVTLVDGPRRLDQVLEGSIFVRVVGHVPDVPPETRLADGELTSTAPGVAGSPPDAADYDRALESLKRSELVNIVCIPPLRPSGSVADGIWVSAARICKELRAFLVVDPPDDKETLDEITAWVRGPLALASDTAGHAAVFFPRIVRPDPLRGGAATTMVPSGAVAGTFARTDASRGVWKAPAGIEAGLAGARPLTPLTDGENGRLNPIGVNCIRTFRDTGTVIWGSRTRRGADALADDYKYIPVRRFALYLEESLYRGTQWVVFEPNDEPLWSQIRNSIAAFMLDLFRRQAFQGATPRDAYFVQCGKDTTTQYDIDRGIVNIWVGFAPLKPAEFVVITIQQKVAQPA